MCVPIGTGITVVWLTNILFKKYQGKLLHSAREDVHMNESDDSKCCL